MACGKDLTCSEKRLCLVNFDIRLARRLSVKSFSSHGRRLVSKRHIDDLGKMDCLSSSGLKNLLSATEAIRNNNSARCRSAYGRKEQSLFHNIQHRAFVLLFPFSVAKILRQ